jgi:CheY-like chemotaxis protein
VLNRLPAGDPLRDLLSEIEKAGRRGESLSKQLLTFNREKTIEPKVLDLNAVVSDTDKMLRRLIGEDILMTTVLAPQLRPVQIDPGQVQQIILNLAVNARDAMPRGGRLTIETENVALDEAYAAAHPHVQPGEYVLLALSDTGVGMPPAVKAHIFDPLFTTKGPGKGTGLGLTIVKSIVNQYGGHIEVYSEVGRGSSFKIYLPQAEEAMFPSKSNPQLRTIPRGTETVLLVEDEDSVRSLAKHVLELSGYQVLDAGDGEAALQLADAYSGPIHLLVTDVVMPQLGGRLLADRLVQRKPQLKLLFLSGYTNEAVVRHGVLESEYAFLQKPFTTAALAQKVRDVLDQPAALKS